MSGARLIHCRPVSYSLITAIYSVGSAIYSLRTAIYSADPAIFSVRTAIYSVVPAKKHYVNFRNPLEISKISI